MKKVLLVASVSSMIGQFNMTNIEILQKMGCQVDVACDFRDRTVWNKERIHTFRKQLKEKRISFYQVDFTRKALKISRHFKAYRQLKDLIEKESYTMIHCHTPVAAAIARIAAHQTRITVIYTAHGFHFFQGAPLKNWILYYPVEKFLSRWTDCLITIKKEDYKRAKKKFHAKRTEYVPGVGVDTQKFFVPDKGLEIKKQKETTADKSFITRDCGKADILQKGIDEKESSYIAIRQEKRGELGVHQDDFVIVSVGELNANKNHRVIIEAVKRLKDKKIKYIVCGMGELKEELEMLIQKEKLEEQVFLLGYREDIREILWAADLFAFPSKREGLGVAAIEAMAAGLPIITSNIHGIKDYSVNGRTGYSCAPENITSFVKAIQRIRDDKKSYAKFHINVKRISKNFDISRIEKIMKKIYKNE